MSFKNPIVLFRDPQTDQAIINASGQIAVQGVNAWSAANQNKKQREWSRSMYDLQREHALSDWKEQNEFNSPESQMRRLKAAGLNPNLVYGQGAVANSSSQVRSSQVENYSPTPIKFDPSIVGETINMYNDLKTRKLQNSNLMKQNELMEQQKLYAAAKTATELSKEGYYPSLTDVAKESKWLTRAKTDTQGNTNKWWEETHAINYETMKYRLANTKADLQNTIAQATKTNAQTNEINTLLPSKLQSNLQDILYKKSATTKNAAELQKIGATILNLQNLSSQTQLKAGTRIASLDFGTYGESKGMFYDQQKKLDQIMLTIDPQWNKKTQKQKQSIIHNLNQ